MLNTAFFSQPAQEQVRDAWGRFLDKADALVGYLPVFGVAIAVIVGFSLIGSLIRRWDGPFRLFSKSQLVRSVLRNIFASIAVIIGIVIALEILNATKVVGAILGAAGVAGLALGFAFKDIVENYLASVILAVRRPFAVRDLVLIDGHEGKVMSLTTRATVLMTLEGNHVRLPNALVFKAVVINYTRNPLRRFEFGVGAGTQEDLTAAQKLGVETLDAMTGVIEDPGPFSLIDDLGDSTVTVRFFGWVDQSKNDFSKVRSEAIRRVKIAFDDAEIEMPEPTYRVTMVEAAPAKKRPAKTKEPETHKAEGLDIGVDDHIDEQMSAEIVTDDEANLLNDS